MNMILEQDLRTSIELFLQTYREDCRDDTSITASYTTQQLINLLKNRYNIDLIDLIRRQSASNMQSKVNNFRK